MFTNFDERFRPYIVNSCAVFISFRHSWMTFYEYSVLIITWVLLESCFVRDQEYKDFTPLASSFVCLQMTALIYNAKFLSCIYVRFQYIALVCRRVPTHFRRSGEVVADSKAAHMHLMGLPFDFFVNFFLSTRTVERWTFSWRRHRRRGSILWKKLLTRSPKKWSVGLRWVLHVGLAKTKRGRC